MNNIINMANMFKKHTLKISTVLILTVVYSVLLGIINFIGIAISHGYGPIILPYLIDPIITTTLFLGLSDGLGYLEMILWTLTVFPIFWPIVMFLLVGSKSRRMPYIILSLVYVLIVVTVLFQLMIEPEILMDIPIAIKTLFEPIGILIFILGQVGIFYVLKLKKKGRLR